MSERIYHNINPFFDSNSKILILGSFPSPKSREQGFFYGHLQNRMWKVLAHIFSEAEPLTIDSKKDFLARHYIAMWDVISSCEISGASDNSIKNAIANDFSQITDYCDIKAVFTTGAKATAMYKKYTDCDSIYLPSPSPANCGTSFEKLIESYKVILEYVN